MKMQRAYRRRTGEAAKLFNGSIHFVRVSFGGVQLSDSDISAVVQYAMMSAGVTRTYCMQYGATTLNVDNNVYPFSWPSSTYNDSDLQNWTTSLAQKYNWPTQDAVVFLNPPGATNTDAPTSSGILGYHNATGIHRPYIFINVEGNNLTVDDRQDVYATALSHEVAEMLVDPLADLSNPEVCDPCAGNCGVDNRNYFNAQGGYLGGGGAPGQGSPATWAYYTDGVVTPFAISACPAPAEACRYDPNMPPEIPPAPPGPEGCIQQIKNGVANLENGNIAAGALEILQGLACLLIGGHLADSGQPAVDSRLIGLQVHKKRPNP